VATTATPLLKGSVPCSRQKLEAVSAAPFCPRHSRKLNELLDRLRRDLALKCVRETDLSLAQVAFLLGYGNQPAFSPAFSAGPA
jgi:transcriptional regulator GlxA family with amidase domain